MPAAFVYQIRDEVRECFRTPSSAQPAMAIFIELSWRCNGSGVELGSPGVVLRNRDAEHLVSPLSLVLARGGGFYVSTANLAVSADGGPSTPITFLSQRYFLGRKENGKGIPGRCLSMDLDICAASTL